MLIYQSRSYRVNQMEERQSRGSSSEQRLQIKLRKKLENVKPPEIYEFRRQCIYRVPQSLRETNPKAYTPSIVCIGPLHRAGGVGKEDNIFESMEDLKLQYLKGFLNRTPLGIGDFVSTLQNLEERIRSCYAEPITYNSDDFLEMILIDACFIIELFMRRHTFENWVEKDPLLQKPWMRYKIYHDLILLENQLPFFVLEELYNSTGMNQEFPFLQIIYNYLKIGSYGTKCPIERPKHLTDLLRTSIISSSQFHFGKPRERYKIEQLYSASQLLEAGLKFQFSPNKNILDLTYSSDRGLLTMPILTIDDYSEIQFRNIVAFEQCHFPDTSIISEYLWILDYLINTEKDVNILVDNKIIVNHLGDANAVATMVNSLGLNLLMPTSNSKEFSDLCDSLNKFYEKPLNKYKAIFMRDYFNTPWKIASTIAAIVLLLLTLIQTICSIISLFRMATMVNSLGLNLVMPTSNSKEFSDLCDSLNKFYEKRLNKYKAIFIPDYFNTPWKIASTIAAIVLLLLTLIQTICSIISLFQALSLVGKTMEEFKLKYLKGFLNRTTLDTRMWSVTIITNQDIYRNIVSYKKRRTKAKRGFFTSYTIGDFGLLKMANDGVTKVIGVKHTPDVRFNLISMHMLDDDCYENHFGYEKWKLTKDNLIVAIGEKISKLNWTKALVAKDNVNMDMKASLWHQRLSHINEN
ncbi:UPF0481 protein, partial [Mucuna pruriens]